MGREFELKFRAEEAQQEAILAKFGAFDTIAMETTYYDTPDRALSARHITLRRRMENGLSVCTVKTPGKDGSRGEWEYPCEEITQAIRALCKLGCPEELKTLTSVGVSPLCGARFTRRAKEVTMADCTVEIALDRGVLLGGGREIPLCEVEVELKSGEEAAALAFAEALAREFDLIPEEKSKFRRASDLVGE